jgi:hypothetical protein
MYMEDVEGIHETGQLDVKFELYVLQINYVYLV